VKNVTVRYRPDKTKSLGNPHHPFVRRRRFADRMRCACEFMRACAAMLSGC
jgi:hypothetical protein